MGWHKAIAAGLITLSLSAIGSAIKAYVDVEKLKTKVEAFDDTARDIKQDVREIKADIKTLLRGR